MIVPPAEVDDLLSALHPITDVGRQIGTDDFMRRYCVDLERLALQAHLSAADEARGGSGGGMANGGINMTTTTAAAGANADATAAATSASSAGGALAELANIGQRAASAFGHEYVAEAILVEGRDRVEGLVRTLLALEAWRTQVLFIDAPAAETGAANDGGGVGGGGGGDALPNQEERVLETDEDGAFDVTTGTTATAVEDALRVRAVDESNPISNEQQQPQQRGLAPLLAKNKNSLRAAFVLHAETTLVGLLALVFYRREAFEPDVLSGEAAVALVDYVARRLAALAVPLDHNPMVSKQRRPRQMQVRTRTALEEIADAALDSHYQTSVAALNLAQYWCQHAEELPLAARSRLLDVHDFPLLMIPLLEEPPWTRRREVTRRRASSSSGNGAQTTTTAMVWEKYIDGNWAEVEPDELLRLTKCEAQPWLVLYHLLCNSPSCREAYGLNAYRKERLLRARKYLNAGALTDQLPPLADLARYLDELSIMGVPEATESTRGRGGGGLVGGGGSGGGVLLLEQVDTLREDVIRTSLAALEESPPSSSGQSERRRGWDGVAQEQFATIFSKVTDATDQTLRLISSEVYGEGLESVLGGPRGGTSDGNTPSTDEVVAGPSLERIVLSVARNATCDPVECIQLVPLSSEVDGKTSTLVDSPDGTGTYRRTKCKVTLLDGSSTASTLVVPSSAGVSAKIFHDGFGQTSTMLELESIDLPVTQAGVKAKKEWRQLGSLGANLVVQLGFKLLPSGEGGDDAPPQWTLSQAFVSQPV